MRKTLIIASANVGSFGNDNEYITQANANVRQNTVDTLAQIENEYNICDMLISTSGSVKNGFKLNVIGISFLAAKDVTPVIFILNLC
jgi:hypothetical protein